jgi:4-amino-4-deoxy-L-arabinose transferase-like glycosyltransferase
VTAPRRPWRAILLAAWAVFVVLALWGAASVPFHPDESTYLYLSRDFDLLFIQRQPARVTWNAAGQPDEVLRHRRLDAPLAYYLAGLGRHLAGRPTLPADWDWSATWDANAAAGALPDAQTLAAARWPAALLTALSLGLVYSLGQRLGGSGAGVAAAVLYGFSGLVLLHGRRAMSEGPLLFFTLLTVWLLARPRPRLGLAAAALAAAIAAKLTAVALLPVAVFALLVGSGEAGRPWAPRAGALARRAALFSVVFLVSLYVVHPALWRSPLAGIGAMRTARAQFLGEQAAFVQAVAPRVRLATPSLRLLAAVYHVFVAPPAYADVGNYAAATAAHEARYAANSLNTGWHTGSLSVNFVLGGLVLSLALLACFQAARRLLLALRRRLPARSAPDAPSSIVLIVLAAWTAFSLASLLAVAVPAQRYFIVLVPIACLWAGAGVVDISELMRRLRPARLRVLQEAP